MERASVFTGWAVLSTLSFLALRVFRLRKPT